MYVGTWCQLFSGTTSTATASTPSNVLQDRGSKWRGYSQKCLVWALLAAVKKHAPGKTRAVRKWCKKNCSHDAPLNLGVEGVNMDQVLGNLNLFWTVHVAKTQSDAQAGCFMAERGAGADERALKRPSRGA